MWRIDDASVLGGSDMDNLACPSYEAGFDACDPVGTVLQWSGREPARILRRRCRSEGVDRSPYDDAREVHPLDGIRHHRALTNKSHFTLSSEAHHERFRRECSLPATQNGDYVMAQDQDRYKSHHQGRSKLYRASPTRPLLVTTLSNTKVDDSRLPKVEELFEKLDHDMMEVQQAKQPLKSILNNPLPKSPPHGILKKPKTRSYQDPKLIEGRRRQRASSESDNFYSNYQIGSPLTGYDSRITYLSNNMKRAKDNSGIGYSYGSVINSISNNSGCKSPNRAGCRSPNRNGCRSPNQAGCRSPNRGSCRSPNRTGCRSPNRTGCRSPNRTGCRSPNRAGCRSPNRAGCRSPIRTGPKNPRCSCKETLHVKHDDHNVHVLRTTAINNETVNMEPILEMPRQDTPAPTCPTVSPALPVSSVTSITVAKKAVKTKKKVKSKSKSNMKASSKVDCGAEAEAEDAHSRSPSPDPLAAWQMETDAAIADIEKLEKPPPCSVPMREEDRHSDQNLVSKLSTKLNGTVVTPKKISSKEIPLCLPETVTNCLRSSLFPRVPPYLKFIGHDDGPMLRVPSPIQKHLKWKLTTITPIIVKKTLTNSGFRLVKSECDTAECPQEETIEWIGIWGKHMKSLMFRAIKDGQKMNHFPGTFQIGRKDRLWRNLQKLASKYGMNEFGIMPKTYVLPHDLKLLKHDWEKYAANNERWIIKPPASARGTGIKVVSKWTQIPKKRPVVVQKYVSKPYLINGSKFDLRLYVLVTSVHPLRIYLYKDGLARFASVKYNDELASLNDRYMHLTNYSINRLSKNYTPNEDFAACEGHKWTLQTLLTYLKTEKKVDTVALWDAMKDLVIKTIISGEASISSLTKANITSRYNCYELFGIDVLLDEDLKPWLLEVNISPSLHSASPLDIHVKAPLVTTVLNIAQFQIPVKTNLEMLSKEKPHKLSGLPYDSRLYTVYLSKEERDKHIIYTNMEDRDMYLRDILSTLTPDDVRHLIQAEDELTQSGHDMERIFPSHDTHKYLGYLAGPRYYNRLFDAWETRYGTNRENGIELLRNLCEIGYHLEVPPVPLKNDVDAPSPAASERPSVPSVASLEQAERPSTAERPTERPAERPTCGDGGHLARYPTALEPRA